MVQHVLAENERYGQMFAGRHGLVQEIETLDLFGEWVPVRTVGCQIRLGWGENFCESRYRCSCSNCPVVITNYVDQFGRPGKRFECPHCGAYILEVRVDAWYRCERCGASWEGWMPRCPHCEHPHCPAIEELEKGTGVATTTDGQP